MWWIFGEVFGKSDCFVKIVEGFGAMVVAANAEYQRFGGYTKEDQQAGCGSYTVDWTCTADC